jgi:hypothetical protein
MDKNWGCGYSVVYDDELNIFKVMVPNDDFYELVLDEIVMENYKIGNYNEFTYKLKKLIDKKTKETKTKYETTVYSSRCADAIVFVQRAK